MQHRLTVVITSVIWTLNVLLLLLLLLLPQLVCCSTIANTRSSSSSSSSSSLTVTSKYPKARAYKHNNIQQPILYSRNARAHAPLAAYSTNIQAPIHTSGDLMIGLNAATATAAAAAAAAAASGMNSTIALSRGPDFNPALLGGIRGYPGIMIRVNMATFRYATMLLRQILDKEIIRARIPPISQQVQQINGRITVCNIHISSYRPPCDVGVVPIAPNHLLISVHDLDIGITGNLDGQIGLLLIPIPLNGIIHVNFYHVSLDVLLSMHIGPDGMPYVNVDSCSACVGYVDLCIECGGLIGAIANLPMFRRMAAEKVQQMVPNELCKAIPPLVNSRVNPMLKQLPRGIPFSAIMSMAGGLLGPDIPAICYSSMCQQQQNKETSTTSITVAPNLAKSSSDIIPSSSSSELDITTILTTTMKPSSVISRINAISAPSSSSSSSDSQYRFKRIFSSALPSPPLKSSMQHKSSLQRDILRSRRSTQNMISNNKQRTIAMDAIRSSSRNVPHAHRPKGIALLPFPVSKQFHQSAAAAAAAAAIYMDDISRQTKDHRSHSSSELYINQTTANKVAFGVGIQNFASNPNFIGGSNMRISDALIANSQVAMRSNPCSVCPPGSGNDALGAVMSLLRSSFSFNRLSDLILSLRILNGYMTPNDFDLQMSGEFSPGGNGGTPFGPFPMQFPSPIGNRMIEALISDYTINSLLYWMHRRGFLGFRIGPDTPQIGPLLKTTCGSDDYSGSSESDENDEENTKKRRRSRRRLSFLQLFKRPKRQDLSSIDLTDLGVCLGDIMPAVAEKYPDKNVTLFIHTARAPSIMLMRGGRVTVDLIVYVDIYIDKTNIRVGTITVTTVIELLARIVGNRLTGTASLPVLKLSDRDKTLGLPEDSLESLASLGKDMIVKAANKQLAKGMELKMPQLNLPVQIINPEVAMLDHAIYLAADFLLSPSLLASL